MRSFAGPFSRRLPVGRVVAFVLLLGAALLLGTVLVGQARPGPDRQAVGTPDPTRPAGRGAAADPGPSSGAGPSARGPGTDPSQPGAPPQTEPAVPLLAYPVSGPGTFQDAPGAGPVHGTAGALRRYRVAVEDRSGVTPADFAAAVDGTLGDARSWIASGRLRVQRVPAGMPVDFTVVLATPATSERLCAEGGLVTERYTSCRLPGRVIINLARWMEAVPDYGAPLATYRRYVVNHEVGHELGEGHEDCPGPGRAAPVMQQQTYGLRSCVANAWPYLDGVRYAGPIVP